jgi:hypothetical protein
MQMMAFLEENTNALMIELTSAEVATLNELPRRPGILDKTNPDWRGTRPPPGRCTPEVDSVRPGDDLAAESGSKRRRPGELVAAPTRRGMPFRFRTQKVGQGTTAFALDGR